MPVKLQFTQTICLNSLNPISNIQTNNPCETKSNSCESSNCTPIPTDNTFLIKLDQPITLEEISNENIAKIVRLGRHCTK